MKQPAFSKIWIIVISLVLIAGGILAWQYFGTPKEERKAPEELADETANWKTYSNEEYGFEFKYPSDLIANTSSQGIPFFGNEKTLIFLIGRNNVIDFSFRVSVFKDNLDILKNSISNYKEQIKQTYIQLSKREPRFSESTTIIGDKSGFIFVNKDELGTEFFYTPLDKQNVLLIGKTGNGNYQLISNQMLSTFRFLE